MKTKILVLSLMLITSYASAQLSEEIIGRWAMETVHEKGKDVSKEHNPKYERWIEFHVDGKFYSDGAPYGKNHGTYTLDENAGTLFLDSSVDDDDSEWHLKIEVDDMTWRGMGDRRKETFLITYLRVDLAP